MDAPAPLRRPQQLIAPLSMAVPLAIVLVAVLAIPLSTAQTLAFTPQQTGTWLFALYGIPGVLSLLLTWYFRQPLFIGWNGFLIAFFASLANQITYADLLGATLISGVVIALLGGLGLTTRVTRIVPAPVVFAVVAASVLPFVVGIFNGLEQAPIVIAGTFLAYLLGRRSLSVRIPPLLPALLVGLLLTGITGGYGTFPAGWRPPPLVVTQPSFSMEAILTVVPVFVVLVALQANLTAVVYLRSQDYSPPARLIDVVCGLSTIAGSVLGPVPICLVSVLTPLTAGPEAGAQALRHWSVYAAGSISIVIAFGAGMAAGLPAFLPLPLLLAIAGFALVGVLAQALGEMVRGPLLLGPLFAFAMASSRVTLFGLGPLFWALVVGTGVSLILESQALSALRTPLHH